MPALLTFSGSHISPEASHVLRETHAARLAGDLGPDHYDAIIARHFCQRSLSEWGCVA
ncbi:MAG: hypothetical protein WC343_02985 [Bacilli bacterium]|jgi:hypothetical protein